MNNNPTVNTISRRLMKTAMRARVFILLVAVLAVPFFSAASASFSESHSRKSLTGTALNVAPGPERASERRPDSGLNNLLGMPASGIRPLLLLPQAAPAEAVTIYQSDCSTPETDFTLGQTVCAKITNAPVGSRPTQILRRLSIAGPGGYIRSKVDVTSATQTLTFTIPTTATSSIGGETIDNRGTWQALGISTRDGEVRASASFTVRDTAQAVADLSITKGVSGAAEVGAGDFVSFNLYVVNSGPDAAANVEITDEVPANTSFQSVSQDSGPTFTCATPTDTTTCTIASLAKGAKAKFTLTYQVNGGTPASTLIINTASIDTTTAQRSTRDNISKAAAFVTAESGGGGDCTLDCPANVIATANATQSGQPGAFVTYGAASVFGDCGSITNNPVSGSFFTVGTHTITSTSEAGPSCTFTVTVLNTPAPTIACPPNKTAIAGGDGTATVDVGTPTFTASGGGTVVGVRSDSTQEVPLALTDPYSTGNTGITWTVTDADGRTASCTQTVVVTAACGTDTTPPTITAPADITVSTGPDNTGCSVALDDELGQADANDDCSVTVTIAGVPAGNVFPKGTTTLTYTATDGAGQTATDTQTVTVVDDTLPHIAAPADAAYTCPSEVPAGHPSQATRGEVLDENGNPLPPGPPFDNCGAPSVTVSDTNNGGAGSASSPLVITRTYTATDAAGNTASASQTITVSDGTSPTVTAPDDATYQCAANVPAAAASQATASDNCAAPNVAVSETNNGGAGSPASPLVITRTYTATDAAGNTASDSQTITVIDNTAPTIALNGANPQVVECHTSYTELGATASDNCAGSFAATPSGGVNVDVPGNYTITYNATDAAGNAATPVTRTVTVVDTTKPVITRNGASSVTVECHTSYTDAGATASDSCDTSVPVTTSGSVNVNVPGTYTITYNASDDSGNAAIPVTRTVNVVDTTAPVITLNGQTLSMWPPNHKYKTFQVTNFVTGASDGCDTPLGVSSVVIEKVTSDETENGNGDGNTMNDIVIAADCKSVQLRAERDGGGNGRVYTITFRLRDASGNTTRVTANVVVPHSNGGTAVDSGVHYTVTSNCP